jgi:hypothetical protein
MKVSIEKLLLGERVKIAKHAYEQALENQMYEMLNERIHQNREYIMEKAAVFLDTIKSHFLEQVQAGNGQQAQEEILQELGTILDNAVAEDANSSTEIVTEPLDRS